MYWNSNVFLKNKFGKGYKISVTVRNHQDSQRIEDVKAFVKTIIPTAELESSFSGILCYQVNRSDLNLAKFFDQMKAGKEKQGIAEWGINQTSLEEVFLKMIREDEVTD